MAGPFAITTNDVEVLTIAVDSVGRVWTTFEQGKKILVGSTTAGGTSFASSPPAHRPLGGSGGPVARRVVGPMTRSRKDAIAEARRLGIIVRPVRRTGEVRFISPNPDEPPVTLNNRRKDASRAVEKLIDRHRPKDDA